MVEHAMSDYATQDGEAARDFEEIFQPQVANPQAVPVFYGNSSFVLPADGTWKVMQHPGPYLNWNLPRPVEEGSSDEESGESATTSSDSDSDDDDKNKNT